MFGLKPWGHHLTNLLLHALNTVLVFLLLRRLTHTLWRSAAVAALFGWHPLHVESVAWVAERKDVLSTFFFLLSLLAYAGYAEDGGRRTEDGDQRSEGGSPWSVVRRPQSPFHLPSSIFYLLSLSCFALGLMSKAMLVTLPCVLLLLDYWPLKRFTIYDLRFTIFRQMATGTPRGGTRPTDFKIPIFRLLLLEKLPFVALAAAACVVTFAVQSHGGAVATVETLPLGARLGNALISYCRYLGKLFWPTHLAIFYPHPDSSPLADVLLAGVFLIGVSALFLSSGIGIHGC